MKQPFVVYVDVDDTLVRTVGSKRIPIPNVVAHVRDLHRQGASLHCWSTGGAEYARASAVELGIADCFVAFLAKPRVIIDDQSVRDWRECVEIHPAQVAWQSVDEYANAVVAFNIRLLPKSERGPSRERVGRITIGTFSEQFACYPQNSDGDVEDFPSAWRAALRRLLGGETPVALIHDPHFAWIVYREGDRCFIRQNLMLNGNFENLPVREPVDEDGQKISEWETNVAAIERFLTSDL